MFGIGCKLLPMNSGRTSRARLAIVLALLVVMGSDSALAALICSRSMGCHATSSIQDQDTPTAGEQSSAADSAVQSMPCCPGSDENAMQCADPAMDCCTLEQGNSQSAVVVSKSNSGRVKLDAALSNTAAANASVTAGQFTPEWSTDPSLYVKPVNQKKTDLRI